MAEKANDQRPVRKRSTGKNRASQEQTGNEATRPTTDAPGGESATRTPPRGSRRAGASAASGTRESPPAATTRPGTPAPLGGQRAARRPRPLPSTTEPAATPPATEAEPITHAPDAATAESDVLLVAAASDAEQPGDMAALLLIEPADATAPAPDAVLDVVLDVVLDDTLDADLLSAADTLLDAEALAEASALAEVAASADAETLEAVLAAEAELAAEEELSETMAELAAVGVEVEVAQQVTSGDSRRTRFQHNNALGMLIERTFEMPGSPCHSYSDLERRSRVSREAISRYVTPRPDRRRSPSIDSLVAIADAMHLSIEVVCRAAAASAKGVIPQPDTLLQTREDVLRTYIAHLSDEQFSAVVELLVQMRPIGAEK